MPSFCRVCHVGLSIATLTVSCAFSCNDRLRCSSGKGFTNYVYALCEPVKVLNSGLGAFLTILINPSRKYNTSRLARFWPFALTWTRAIYQNL